MGLGRVGEMRTSFDVKGVGEGGGRKDERGNYRWIEVDVAWEFYSIARPVVRRKKSGKRTAGLAERRVSWTLRGGERRHELIV